MIHPSEPTLAELYKINEALLKADATDETRKKLHAIEFQIARHEADAE